MTPVMLRDLVSDVVAGADPIASGTIVIDGRDLAPRSPADSLGAGIVLTVVTTRAARRGA